jgi:hypothetical protein
MSDTEEARTDPSGGKSGASPSGPGKGNPKNTAQLDPDTQQPPPPGAIPQTPPVPDTPRVLNDPLHRPTRLATDKTR